MLAQIQFLGAFAHGKRLYLFYNPVYPLAFNNQQKFSAPTETLEIYRC